MNWPAIPFVRLLLPFCIGILTGFLPLPFSLTYLSIPWCLLVLSLLVFFSHSQLPFHKRRRFGLLIFLCLIGFGFLLTHLRLAKYHPNFISSESLSANYWALTVQTVKKTEKSIRLTTTVRSASDSNQVNHTKGKLLLYLQKTDSLAHGLKAGDQLLVETTLRPLKAPKNPLAFDYAAYMAAKGVYHQAFAKPQEWIKTGHAYHPIRDRFTWLRHYGLQVLAKHLPGPTELAVGAALIAGRRDTMNDAVRQAYTATGAVHVLAVSGLHIGMIYLALHWLLGYLLGEGPSRRWLRALLLLLSIWVFALFTGGSASVLRSATMFSFIILGQAFHRRQNIYNSLAASAFLLLCIQPTLLRDVGFQLSYLAVIGIVFFQGRIYRAVFFHHRLADYLWKFCSVSIAAQLTTLPISLFYFHQFPVYFWLSGWVVVPAAMCILCVGLLLLLLGKVAIIGSALGWLLNGLIQAMNAMIFQIESLPGGLIHGFWPSVPVVLLLYAVLICLMIGLSRKRLPFIQYALCLLLLVMVLANGRWHQSQQQKRLVIYHQPGHTLIDIIDGQTAYCFTDLATAAPALDYSAGNFRDYALIQDIIPLHSADTLLQGPELYFRDHYLCFADKGLLIVEDVPNVIPKVPLPVDYLLLRDDPHFSLENLDQYYQFQSVIFDTSNSPRRVRQWQRICTEKGWDCYDVSDRGALVIDLN